MLLELREMFSLQSSGEHYLEDSPSSDGSCKESSYNAEAHTGSSAWCELCCF